MKRLVTAGQPEGAVMAARRSGRGLALRARFTWLGALLTKPQAKLTELKAYSKELRAKFTELRAYSKELRAKFTELKAYSKELRARFTELRAKFTELRAPAMLLLALVSSDATAQQFDQVGSNQIHYAAIETTFIADEIAARFGLERRPGLGMVTVSVLDANGESRNVAVDGSIADLNGRQPRPLAFRRLREASGGISSIATFPIDYAAPMRFQLDVQLDRNASPHPVSFIQRFYRDE
ncbi:DUF4426 domain-containing protein [Halomonas cupida]|uniref:DUF4426 domain-containing protein n=1 Tax=Halomonas cupida TaxID=44933 RepID=UPI003A8D1F4D